MYLAILSESLVVTGPIFLIMLLGLILRRVGIIDDNFNQIAAKLVFSICLPALLFTVISQTSFNETFKTSIFYFSIAATVVGFLLSWLLVMPVHPRADRGVMVQGAFRGNLGVIGITVNGYYDDSLQHIVCVYP